MSCPEVVSNIIQNEEQIKRVIVLTTKEQKSRRFCILCLRTKFKSNDSCCHESPAWSCVCALAVRCIDSTSHTPSAPWRQSLEGSSVDHRGPSGVTVGEGHFHSGSTDAVRVRVTSRYQRLVAAGGGIDTVCVVRPGVACAQTIASGREMQAVVWLVMCLAAAAPAADAARILAVLPTNTRSHYAMYGRLVEALAKKDHQMTIISHFPMKNPPPNVETISLAGTIPEITNNLTRQNQSLKPSFVVNLENIMKECVQACETVSRLPAVQALLNSTVAFDLVIVEVFGSECFLPLGQRFQAPVVGLLSSVPLPWVNEQLGNPEATSYVPAYMMRFGQRMNLWERFANTVSVLWAKMLYKYKSQIPSQVIADRLFGAGPKLEDLAKNYSLVLSNSHFSINEVRPIVPAMVEVGGLHLDDTQKLSKEMKTLLDSSPEGVIYWSFGSMSRIETIPSEKLAQIFEALSRMSQTVLIKMNRGMLARNLTVPDNVYTMDWIPQYATLCHPNVKLFIGHGGLLGTQEAVACGVPMLMVPLYADQALNAHAMTDRGVARTHMLKEGNADTWTEAMQDLLRNPTYKENALRLRDVFLDRPMPPLDTGVYWIEYVIRHKGATHLRSPALDLPLPQYLLLDVVALSLAATVMTIFILHTLFRYLCTRCIKWWAKHKTSFSREKLSGKNISLFLCLLLVRSLRLTSYLTHMLLFGRSK